MEEIYRKTKNLARNALIIYVVIGSIYMMSETAIKGLTGHYSADVALGKIKPTKLEKKLTSFIEDTGRNVINLIRE